MLHLANFGKTDPIMTNTQLLNIKVDKYNKKYICKCLFLHDTNPYEEDE